MKRVHVLANPRTLSNADSLHTTKRYILSVDNSASWKCSLLKTLQWVKYRTAIKALLLYFNLCICVNSKSFMFIYIHILANEYIIWCSIFFTIYCWINRCTVNTSSNRGGYWSRTLSWRKKGVSYYFKLTKNFSQIADFVSKWSAKMNELFINCRGFSRKTKRS